MQTKHCKNLCEHSWNINLFIHYTFKELFLKLPYGELIDNISFLHQTATSSTPNPFHIISHSFSTWFGSTYVCRWSFTRPIRVVQLVNNSWLKVHYQLFCYPFSSTGGYQSAGAHDQRPSKLCETRRPHCLCPHHDPADRSHLSQGKGKMYFVSLFMFPRWQQLWPEALCIRVVCPYYSRERDTCLEWISSNLAQTSALSLPEKGFSVQSSFLLICTPRYLQESTVFTHSSWMKSRTGGLLFLW